MDTSHSACAGTGRTDQNAEAIKQGYQTTVSSIKQYLASLSASAAQFNGQLEGVVASQIKERKNRLLADAGMTAAIGPPLKKREGIPLTYSVPVLFGWNHGQLFPNPSYGRVADDPSGSGPDASPGS